MRVQQRRTPMGSTHAVWDCYDFDDAPLATAVVEHEGPTTIHIRAMLVPGDKYAAVMVHAIKRYFKEDGYRTISQRVGEEDFYESIEDGLND